jgi:hypothetical protein
MRDGLACAFGTQRTRRRLYLQGHEQPIVVERARASFSSTLLAWLTRAVLEEAGYNVSLAALPAATAGNTATTAALSPPGTPGGLSLCAHAWPWLAPDATAGAAAVSYHAASGSGGGSGSGTSLSATQPRAATAAASAAAAAAAAAYLSPAIAARVEYVGSSGLVGTVGWHSNVLLPLPAAALGGVSAAAGAAAYSPMLAALAGRDLLLPARRALLSPLLSLQAPAGRYAYSLATSDFSSSTY